MMIKVLLYIVAISIIMLIEYYRNRHLIKYIKRISRNLYNEVKKNK